MDKKIFISKSDAISLFGSGYALSKLLGISPPAVSQWAEWIPDPRASQIVRLARELGKEIETYSLEQNDEEEINHENPKQNPS